MSVKRWGVMILGLAVLAGAGYLLHRYYQNILAGAAGRAAAGGPVSPTPASAPTTPASTAGATPKTDIPPGGTAALKRGETRATYKQERQKTIARLQQKDDPRLKRLKSQVQQCKAKAGQAILRQHPDLARMTDPTLRKRRTAKLIQEAAKAGDKDCRAFIQSRTELDEYLYRHNPALKKLRAELQGQEDEP